MSCNSFDIANKEIIKGLSDETIEDYCDKSKVKNAIYNMALTDETFFKLLVEATVEPMAIEVCEMATEERERRSKAKKDENKEEFDFVKELRKLFKELEDK